MRVLAISQSALLPWRSPPRLRRCRVVLPLDASIGEAPQSAASAASLRSRVGLSPATSSMRAAISGPMPDSLSRRGGARRQLGEDRVELGDLGVEGLVAAGEAAQRVTCRAEAVASPAAMYPCAAGDELAVGELAERLAQLVGRGHDQVLEMQDRLRASLDRTGPRVAQHPDRFDDPVTGLRLGGRLAGEDAACGGFGVAGVVLAAVAAADSRRPGHL